jgi:type I restriction enzyme, R subunit
MSSSPSEQWTRKQRIDRMLDAAGWQPIVPYSPHGLRDRVALEEYPTASGPADYLLVDRGEPLAIVEAKKQAVGAQNVLQQAQRYARGLADSPFDFGGYRVPFIYATNGEQLWFQDLRTLHSRSRQVSAFHTPAALRALLGHDVDASLAWLANHPIDHPALRPYQREAIEAIEAALRQGRRKLLVSMATGTGKTLTTIALLYRLLQAGLVRRILFLVDRRALAAQAVAAFSRFTAAPGLKFDRVYEVYSQRFRSEDMDDAQFNPRVLPTSYLTNPDAGQTFVYVSTIQRMQINLFGLPPNANWTGGLDDERDAGRLDVPIHAFDLIVADECHRGYTTAEASAWREVLEHFDGVKLGLTATPTAQSLAYFEHRVFSYGYEQAVRKGYLVDYDAVVVESTITMQGAFLREGEEVGLLDRQTGQIQYEVLEDQRELPPSELDDHWAAPDRDRKVVDEVARYLRAQEQLKGYLPKTLVFAHNDLLHGSHADRLVNLLRDAFGRGDSFVQKITGSPNVDRPLQHIREFRNRPEPAIVVTVDMLSTGVDIPALENIVFLRPVKSRVLFEQMMGRGTRRCDDIGKAKFTVYDAVGVLQYFAQATAFTADAPAKPTRPIDEVIQAIAANRDRAYNTRVLVKRLQRIAKEISAEGRELLRPFIADGDIAAFAADLPTALETRWAATMQVLGNPTFQQLLASYPRARQPFLIAETAEDYVVSELRIRTADGRALRPDDYIASFEQFVRANADQIAAIRVLLDRPTDWSTEALQELRQKLAARPEGFTEERLRQAYQYHLADIISLVKHAARGEPLHSAQERVDRALAQLRAGRSFTEVQERWLALIRSHLIENLALDREDFRLLTFTRAGATWGRVNADFDGQLDAMMAEINGAMAA